MDTPCPTRLKLLKNSEITVRPERQIVIMERHASADLGTPAEIYLACGPRLILTRGTPRCIEREIATAFPRGTEILLADTLELVRLYAGLADLDEVRFRLERVTDDSCRCFHADNVRLRLLCTYAGPGTQWRMVGDETIHTLPPRAVALLQGRQFPSWNERTAILHRSPPLTDLPETQRRRLLLTIDEPTACGMSAIPSTTIAA